MPELPTEADPSRPHALTPEWRNDDSGPRPTAAEVSAYGGVARKP